MTSQELGAALFGVVMLSPAALRRRNLILALQLRQKRVILSYTLALMAR